MNPQVVKGLTAKVDSAHNVALPPIRRRPFVEPTLTPPASQPESERVHAVEQMEILDSPPEPEFDALARLAACVTGAPAAFVGLFDADRLWLKAEIGLGHLESAREIPRVSPFCHPAGRPAELTLVADLAHDPLFQADPWVTGAAAFRFYASLPLMDESGHCIGSLGVLDVLPRSLSPDQHHALKDVALLTVKAMEGRRSSLRLLRESNGLSLNQGATQSATQSATPLTSRPQFDLALDVELRHSMRTGEPFTVLQMELDGFKAIVQGFGGAAGEQVVNEVVARLGQQVRLGDLLIRLERQAFCVLMRHGAEASAEVLAARVIKAVSQPIVLATGDQVGVGISVGIAAYNDAVESAAALLEQAGQALTAARQQNERHWNFFGKMFDDLGHGIDEPT